MGLETFTGLYIDGLNPLWPTGAEGKDDGDNHLRGLKTVLQNQFPNLDGPVNSTDEELNYLASVTAGTAAASKALVLNTASQVSAFTSNSQVLNSPTLNTPTLTSAVLDTAVSGTAVESSVSTSTTKLSTSGAIKTHVDSIIDTVVNGTQHNEYHADGTLVYPYQSIQTVTYSGVQVDYVTTTYSGITYTMTINYNASDQVSSIVVTDDTTSDTYTATPTYNSDSQVTTLSAWVRS